MLINAGCIPYDLCIRICLLSHFFLPILVQLLCELHLVDPPKNAFRIVSPFACKYYFHRVFGFIFYATENVIVEIFIGIKLRIKVSDYAQSSEPISLRLFFYVELLFKDFNMSSIVY